MNLQHHKEAMGIIAILLVSLGLFFSPYLIAYLGVTYGWYTVGPIFLTLFYLGIYASIKK